LRLCCKQAILRPNRAKGRANLMENSEP